MAMPWPPATHMVSSPIVLSSDSRSFSSVVMMRAPVMPNGWPRAIAPPCGFSFSRGIPHSSMIGITCAANASFSSTTSTSSMALPARPSTFLIAPIGATPMISGSSPLLAGATPAPRGEPPRGGRKHARGRLEPQPLRARVRHHEHGGGAVVERTRVARGHAAVLLERRLQRLQLLESAVGPRSVVLVHTAAVGQLHRDDLAVEEALVARLHCQLLRALRVLVHVVALHVVPVGHVLGRHAHLDVGVRPPVLAVQLRVVEVGLRNV